MTDSKSSTISHVTIQVVQRTLWGNTLTAADARQFIRNIRSHHQSNARKSSIANTPFTPVSRQY